MSRQLLEQRVQLLRAACGVREAAAPRQRALTSTFCRCETLASACSRSSSCGTMRVSGVHAHGVATHSFLLNAVVSFLRLGACIGRLDHGRSGVFAGPACVCVCVCARQYNAALWLRVVATHARGSFTGAALAIFLAGPAAAVADDAAVFFGLSFSAPRCTLA